MSNATASTNKLARTSPTPGMGEKPLVWIDGELVPANEAKVSVFDHGFLYGDGVFEGIRVYRGKIFKCQSHVERIFRNASAIYLDQQSADGRDTTGSSFPYTKDEIVAVMEECVRVNEIEEGYIRLIFSRGVGNLGLHPFKCPRPSVVVIADTISLYPEEMYTEGMKVIVAKRPRIPTVCLDPKLKPMNYLNNILAKVEAIDADVLEAIMLRYTESDAQIVGECTGDNLFIIKDGVVRTSPLDVGMLDGITRAFVINELIPRARLTCVQEALTLDEVINADEIFLTGTAAEIIAVRMVEDKKISDGEGPLTKKLRELFREAVSGDNVPTD